MLPSWYSLPYQPLSGIFFKEQAQAIAKLGHRVGTLYAETVSIKFFFKHKFKYGAFASVEKGVVESVALLPHPPRMERLASWMKIQTGILLFKRYVSEYGTPDIVHVQSFEAGMLAIKIKEGYGVPFVVTEHSSKFARKLLTDRLLTIARQVFDASSDNLAVSRSLGDVLQTMTGKRFYIVPNMVDTDFFIPRKQKVKRSEYQFISIGSLDSNKNHAVLLDAFAAVFRGNKSVRLVMVGSGPEHNALEKKIRELQLEEQARLYGQASRDEVRDLLNASDCYVHSSRYETFGVALIEAMSCGLPIVSTRCGGPESIVANDNLGLLTEMDVKAFSRAMADAAKTDYDKTYIRAYAVEHFSVSAVSKTLTARYEKVLKENRSGIKGCENEA